MNTIVISAINHSYGSYWHQLSDSELGHHLVKSFPEGTAVKLLVNIAHIQWFPFDIPLIYIIYCFFFNSTTM